MTTVLAMNFALCAPAHAKFSDIFCDETTRLQEQLETVVGAQPQASGLRDPGSLIEIWIVPSSGDWTIVQNYANGTSCILAIGQYWEAAPQEPV